MTILTTAPDSVRIGIAGEHEGLDCIKENNGGAESGSPNNSESSALVGSVPGRTYGMKNIDFDAVNRAALSSLPSLLCRWLPDGHAQGREYVARNPRRADRKPGSFKVNLRSGKWCDFATGDAGGDVVSLAAYLSGTGQVEAARNLSQMLGVNHG